MTGVDDNLAVRGQFELGTVHRSRRRIFQANSLVVVAAAVARELEFVLRWLPISSAPRCVQRA